MIKLYSIEHNVKRELPFTYFIFKGGEPHVELKYVGDNEVLIDARIPNMYEFAALLVLTSALKQQTNKIHLYIPYFPGARQDRYERGSGFTAKVFADIINLQNYKSVTVLDPHSNVVPALLNNCKVEQPNEQIKEFIKDLNVDWVICPDAGAEKRSYDIAKMLKLPILHCRKHRDVTTGKLSGFTVDTPPKTGSMLLVDDICDGGGTFIGIAEKIFEKFDGNLYLWVTHGIFSKGIEPLRVYFKKIGCTDSLNYVYTTIKRQVLEVYKL